MLDQCRQELVDLGRSDLADGVQQVSEISDLLGYDIAAPTVGGPVRLVEVKGSGRHRGNGLFEFFLSRNEYDVGRRNPRRWSLVACDVTTARPVVVGHCPAATLTPFLPEDGSGRWTEALLAMPVHLLREGLPPPVA